MIRRLIRIYTPFVCAIFALAHGVLSLTGYKGLVYHVFGEIAGHSILLLLYVLATSTPRMNKWYRRSIYLLLSIHVLNLIYLTGALNYYALIYAGIVLNILAVISFLIYRFYVGITKIFQLYDIRSIERE